MNNLTKYGLALAILLIASSALARRPSLRQRQVSPRVQRPVQVSVLLKGGDLAGMEVGVRTIDGHVEFHLGAGSSLIDTVDPTCKQNNPTCLAPPVANFNAGVRWYPLSREFSPYMSVGVMGSMNTTKAPVGLVGGGIHWQGRSGLTANLGLEYAVGETNPERMIIPTLTVGIAF
jgi:hypothetical protein